MSKFASAGHAKTQAQKRKILTYPVRAIGEGWQAWGVPQAAPRASV